MNCSQRLCSASAVAVFAFLLVFSFGAPRPVFAVAANPSEGGAFFKSKCAMCHGPDGSGNTALGKAMGIVDLRSALVQKLPNVQLSAIISKGKGKMPAFGDSLSKPQTKALIAFIRSLAKKK